MYRDIQMIRAIAYLAMILVIGACFNIVSTLVMAVKDKSGDIGGIKNAGGERWLGSVPLSGTDYWRACSSSLIGVATYAVVSLQLTAIINGIEKGDRKHRFCPAIFILLSTSCHPPNYIGRTLFTHWSRR